MLVEIKDSNGKTVGIMLVNPKTFSTGSTGYFGTSKVEIDGKRFQTQVMMVEIGSKPNQAEV